jgi:hypothetical protein
VARLLLQSKRPAGSATTSSTVGSTPHSQRAGAQRATVFVYCFAKVSIRDANVSNTQIRTFMQYKSSLILIAYSLACSLVQANSNNAPRIVELADLDLSKPIPSNVCVKDSPKGKAFDKMIAMVQARGQKSVVAGDQVLRGDNSRENIISSTLKQGGEGYKIASDRPLGKQGTEYCFTSYPKVYIYSVFNATSIPSLVNKGELGLGLSNSHIAGSKVAIVMLTEKGTLAAVNFNPNTGKGAVHTADGNGDNSAGIALLVKTGYSSTLPKSAKKALGVPDE